MKSEVFSFFSLLHLRMKSKPPKKNATREPNDKDTVELQDAPRKYKQLAKILARPRHVKPERKQTINITQVYEKHALLAKRATNKFAKQKEYWKSKLKNVEEGVLENNKGQSLFNRKDNVRFNEVVLEPPKISIKPKNKVYLPGQKPAKTNIEITPAQRKILQQKLDTATVKDLDVGRKRKLKDLPEYEKKLVLEEREKVIKAYRDSKKSK
jgi:hypothetical protein